ncbi:MAG: YdcF family protein [Clostridia bacterium]|nr:YdcF family protein [Clostridia bacterium]
MNKLKKFAAVLLSILLAAGLFSLAVNLYVKNVTADKIRMSDDISEKYDCILVLGCGVLPDGKPSNMLHDRLKRGVELYKSGAAGKIIMSGDHGRKEYDEVNVMREFALNAGIPPEDIFMDHAGFSTYESMYRARDIFEVKKMLVVTQRYHLFRALYIAGKLGIDADGTASDYHKYYGQKIRDLREFIAIVKDFLVCMIQPEPTYLGDTIPVGGNGTATLD